MLVNGRQFCEEQSTGAYHGRLRIYATEMEEFWMGCTIQGVDGYHSVQVTTGLNKKWQRDRGLLVKKMQMVHYHLERSLDIGTCRGEFHTKTDRE